VRQEEEKDLRRKNSEEEYLIDPFLISPLYTTLHQVVTLI
jgi:hypothetical protein